MKKMMSFVLIVVFALSLMVDNVSAASKKFPDVKDTDWFAQYVYKATEKGFIGGYPSGKFGPADNSLVAQIVKMVLEAKGYKNLKYYKGYIEKAEELSLILTGEFNGKADYEREMRREEIARVIIRALKNETYPDNINEYKALIKDFHKVTPGFEDYVIKAYYLGIIEGGPGGFNPTGATSRAAASKMILAMIDPNYRALPVLDKGDTKVISGYSIPKESTVVVNADKDTVNHSEIYIAIALNKDLSVQYSEAEAILQSKFGKADTINQIMEYLKKKTDEYTKLPTKEFFLNGHKILVGGSGYGCSIVVYQKGH